MNYEMNEVKNEDHDVTPISPQGKADDQSDGLLSVNQVQIAMAQIIDDQGEWESWRVFFTHSEKAHWKYTDEMTALEDFLADNGQDARDVLLWYIERTFQTDMLKEWLAIGDEPDEVEGEEEVEEVEE